MRKYILTILVSVTNSTVFAHNLHSTEPSDFPAPPSAITQVPENKVPLATARFKLITGYNVSHLFHNENDAEVYPTQDAIYEFGFGTDINFNRYVKGLTIQLQSSVLNYDYYSLHWGSKPYPEWDDNILNSNTLRLAGALQYAPGNWRVRPLARLGFSESFDLKRLRAVSPHVYGGVGCIVNMAHNQIAIHADWWSHTYNKFFLSADFIF